MEADVINVQMCRYANVQIFGERKSASSVSEAV